MTVAATAKRRRKQISQGYTHIARLGRPVYRGTSKVKSERKLRLLAEKALRAKSLMSKVA